MDEIDEKINYWLEMAKYDIKTTKAMLKTKRYLYVGFMAHQTVEKLLKAFYIFTNKQTPPYTHNLVSLAKKTKIYSLLDKNFLELLDILEPLNIEARYPTHKDNLLKSLNRNRCANILKRTEEFYKWIRNMLLKK